MTDRDYQHSRPLDVHRWSEHTEANKFIDYVYDTYLNTQSNENQRIKKRHLKVVLLDIYVAWLNDPELNIAVHMTTGAYSDGTVFNKGKSRYNELNIKVSTIEIIHRLREADLIGFKKGFERSATWQGYISRIWPTNKLTKLFEDAAFGEFDIGYTDNRETIILRDEEKDEVEYTDKTHIKQMRLAVQQYNKLLEKTFIDIQWVDKPARIELLDTIKEHHPNISHLICSGAGLRLMNIDSRICDYVIADFVKTDTPIMTVHDSFIVQIGEEDRLNQLMKEAFEDVTYKVGIKAKFNQNLTRTQLYAHGAQDRDWYLRMANWITKGSPTIGYQSRLERHREYFGQ